MQYDELGYVIEKIVELTDVGGMKWLCLDYEPITLMSTDDENKAYLTQSLSVISEYRNQFFYFEFDDFLDIPSGQGYMQTTFRSDMTNEYYREGVFFSHNAFYRLSNLIYTQLLAKNEIVPSFDIERISHKDYKFLIASHPLVRLARVLQRNRLFAEFHRCVLDDFFSSSVVSEISILV